MTTNSNPKINNSSAEAADRDIENSVQAIMSVRADASTLDAAQRKLLLRLDKAQTARRDTRPFWALATAAVLAILILPMVIWMPGSGNGVAFAQVQNFFSTFSTMRAQLTTTMGEQVILDMDVFVDGSDRARIDAEDQFTLIVDPTRDEFLQLNHMLRQAWSTPLAGDSDSDSGSMSESDAIDDDPLAWLDDIRQFEGEADRLDERRLIRDHQATGFALEAGGQSMTLWSTDEGQPLRLVIETPVHEGERPLDVQTRIDFYFDEVMDEAIFDLTVPEGYQVNNIH